MMGGYAIGSAEIVAIAFAARADGVLMKSFEGKVAAITGAASGMGRSLAVALARRGSEVALCDVDEVGLAETARLARAASNVRVTTRRVDVSDETAMRTWAQSVASEHGRCNLI